MFAAVHEFESGINRAEQCPLSGVDPPTYAQCEFFAF